MDNAIYSNIANIIKNRNKKVSESDYNKFINASYETVKRLKKITEVVSIILFGSVARGDFVPNKSDIDFYVIINSNEIDKSKYDKIASEISTSFQVPVQIEVQGLKIDEQDQSLLIKIGIEGKVVYNKGGLIISQNLLGLTPYTILEFSTEPNSALERVKLSRKLNGYNQKVDGKIVSYKGLIDNEKVFGTGKGFLLIQQSNLDEVINFLKKCNVKFKIITLFYK